MPARRGRRWRARGCGWRGRARARPPEHAPPGDNTWEAVYFDHRLDKLTDLAERAAAVGVGRFVLDDGWFTVRRGDSAGLGDWNMDPQGAMPPVRAPQPRMSDGPIRQRSCGSSPRAAVCPGSVGPR
ncbi:alpha-galactosidase [Kitasatospora sp. NPDC048296]|uniref:alpha-galactosidase n=1 Tax=Kitasatospora sp. NPDC048296 TaxID=3364048 RepID=UPI003719612F